MLPRPRGRPQAPQRRHPIVVRAARDLPRPRDGPRLHGGGCGSGRILVNTLVLIIIFIKVQISILIILRIRIS